jgi:hypothetical protein
MMPYVNHLGLECCLRMLCLIIKAWVYRNSQSHREFKLLAREVSDIGAQSIDTLTEIGEWIQQEKNNL